MKANTFSHIFTAVCAVMFAFCLFNSAQIAAQSVYYLKLCAAKVIPALFVYSVLCSVICQSTLFFKLCAVPWFGTEAAVLALGLLGGFPLGATVSAELYDNGVISKKQAEYLCSFTNNPSLSFIISYTGAVLGSKRIAVSLALLTVASAMLTALIMKYTYLNKNERLIILPRRAVNTKSFARIITDSCYTLLTVCGCIVFFGSISVLFPEYLRGFFELSGGISACTEPVSAAVLLGFSGLSVMLQIAAVCDKRLSLKPYAVSKLAQSAIMGIFAYFLFDYVK